MIKIKNVPLSSPFVIAPMAGMTDTAFRRLVKRQGGCGLVVTPDGIISSRGADPGADLVHLESCEVSIFGLVVGAMAARDVPDLRGQEHAVAVEARLLELLEHLPAADHDQVAAPGLAADGAIDGVADPAAQ